MSENQNFKVSCIVPAYNEGPRINNVLNALIGHPLVDEVIVVNDGSKDDTEAVLKAKTGINLITYSQNRGKSHAVMLGFKAARNDLIMMIDSDLLGLTASDITALINPVKSGSADISMSLRQNSLNIYRFFDLDFVSGERVFNKKIIGDLNQIETLPGFALETFLNQIIIKQKLRLKVVDWTHVQSPRKSSKAGFWAGAKADMGMIRQIVAYAGLFQVIKIFIAMLSLKV